MIATRSAREFNQEPSKVLRQVERGETVVIEKHGVPCVVMMPYRTGGISGEELARRLRQIKPDPDAAREVKEAIAAMDDASRRSYPH